MKGWHLSNSEKSIIGDQKSIIGDQKSIISARLLVIDRGLQENICM